MTTAFASRIVLLIAVLFLAAPASPPNETGCTHNWNCPWNHYCQKANGDCAGIGVCAPLVDGGCPEVWDPVCGCDGQTYSSACHAHLVGVNVLGAGECHFGPCDGNDACPDGFWCSKPAGECDGVGECVPFFDGFCIMIYAPVCGCDGVTYGNSCLAALQGVNIQHTGKCNAASPMGAATCSPDNPCAPGTWCSASAGNCGGEGLCMQQFLPGQMNCLDVWLPVCGCDGHTYSNDCYALLAGVGVAHEGECGASCHCDINGDGSVDIFDLLGLLSQWGPCPAPCAADLTKSGSVDIFDLLEVLAHWGPCQ